MTPADIHVTGEDIHGHVLFVYESKQERLRVLAEYFGTGLERGEQCIFVTSESPKKALAGLRSAGLDASEAHKKGALRIFEMTSTYLPHGKFVGNYMLLNVTNFILDAETSGYTGVRTAGEMSWLYDNIGCLGENASYEHQISDLQSSNPKFTGLCLYPVRQGSGEILDSALQTHPSVIYDGTLRTNPFSEKTMPA